MDKLDRNVNSQNRRRFVKKAAVGAALVSLPVRSVWANGITNSIVASGHGSDWANNQTLTLQGPNYWLTNIPLLERNTRFNLVFGGNAIKGKSDSSEIKTNGDGSVKVAGDARTLSDILELKNNTKPAGEAKGLAGPNDYNRLLVSMYLNAKYSGNPVYDVEYPVANGRPFANADDFAKHLYSITSGTPDTSALALADLISNPSAFTVTQ